MYYSECLGAQYSSTARPGEARPAGWCRVCVYGSHWKPSRACQSQQLHLAYFFCPFIKVSGHCFWHRFICAIKVNN